MCQRKHALRHVGWCVCVCAQLISAPWHLGVCQPPSQLPHITLENHNIATKTAKLHRHFFFFWSDLIDDVTVSSRPDKGQNKQTCRHCEIAQGANAGFYLRILVSSAKKFKFNRDKRAQWKCATALIFKRRSTSGGCVNTDEGRGSVYNIES